MPAEWKKCVASVKKTGKSEKRAYAICTAAYIKKHGRSPQSADKLEENEELLAGVFSKLSIEGLELFNDELETKLAELVQAGDEEVLDKWIRENLVAVDTYEKTFDMPADKVYSTISGAVKLSEIVYDYEKEKDITIEVLREGKFEHPYYDTINFDKKIFATFVRNFKDGIPQEHIAYDYRHQPDWGAAAWLKKLFHKGGKLFANVELTRRGYKSLKEKEFLYFSTEYHDAYKDRESGKLHGPTILGGGLTNRPFIKGMAPILMSEDGEEVFVPSFELGDRKKKKKKKDGTCEDPNTQLEGGSTMKKLLEALKALKDKIVALTEADDGVQKKDLEEMTASMETLTTGISELKPEDLQGDDKKENEAKLEELNERVVSLSERLGKLKVADPKADSKLEKLDTRLGKFEKILSDLPVDQTKLLEEANAELEAKVKLLEDGNTTLGDSIKKLQERGEARDKELHEAKVATFTKELAEQGFWPGTCQEVTALLEAYEGQGTAVVTLSEEEGEGDKKKKVEKKLSMQDVISRILLSIPEDARIDTTERSQSPTGNEGDDKMLTVPEIEKMATEQKLSYGQMCVKLSNDPVYKDRINI